VAEAVIRHRDDVGRGREAEGVELLQEQPDLGVVGANAGARLRRAGAEPVLDVVGLGEPVDHHVGLELGQDVVAQHALGPGDRGVVVVDRAALGGRGAEALEHRFVDLGRERHAHARLPIAADQHADPLGRARVEQQRLAGRAGAYRREPLAALGEDFAQALHQHHAAARHLVEAEQVAVIVVVERAVRVDRADINAVAEDAVAVGIGAGCDRRRIHPGDGRKHRVAVHEIDALPAQPQQIRRVLRRDRIRPQPVEHQDEVEGGARRRARFRASVTSAFTRVFRRAMRAHYRVAALAARFARQRGAARFGRKRSAGENAERGRGERGDHSCHRFLLGFLGNSRLRRRR